VPFENNFSVLVMMMVEEDEVLSIEWPLLFDPPSAEVAEPAARLAAVAVDLVSLPHSKGRVQIVTALPTLHRSWGVH
jgi:hypothetical protein